MRAVFGPIAADHIARPRYAGLMEDATHYGVCGTPCEEPYVEVWLTTRGERIVRDAKQTNGCPAKIASASLTAQLITGRIVDQALLIEAKDVLQILGGFPSGKERCPAMSAKALRTAIAGEQSC